jgi:hypothetical protein
MSHGKTITTYLIDGKLKGPRYVKFNETSHYLYILPREIASKLSTAQDDFPEYATSGFYILTGTENGNPKAYIGQSNKCKHRISQHDKKISWWDTAYVYVSKTIGELDATTIQYLEAKNIADAKDVGNNVTFDNANSPTIPHLSKDQEATIKHYYEEAKMLLEFAGCGVFVKAEIQEGDIYYINAPMKGVAAKGIYYPETHKVVVLTGSTVDPKFANSYRNKEARAKLMAEITQTDKNGMPVTTKDHTFDSPSAAAKFVLGRPANGLDEWKDKEGKSLNDLKK